MLVSTTGTPDGTPPTFSCIEMAMLPANEPPPGSPGRSWKLVMYGSSGQKLCAMYFVEVVPRSWFASDVDWYCPITSYADFVFSTFRNWELIIFSQRERLARISSFAEELRERYGTDNRDALELIDKICYEASQRL